MFDKNLSPKKRERKFNEFLITEYLKYGSVDEVFKRNNHDIPISYAQYQRILEEWGIVKAAGPNSKLTETLGFLTKLTEEKIPLEMLYKKMPSSFLTSAATMYRILGYIKEGITRRIATGLVITSSANKNKILIAKDVSVPRIELGKPYSCLSIPMGFSRKRDPREEAILRVLQQEVFAEKTIKRKIPNIIPERPKPFMFLDIADVRVEIFHLVLPKRISDVKNFSSFKLKNYKYMDIDKVKLSKRKNFRVGVVEAVKGYKKYLEFNKRNLVFNPLQYRSHLNYYLAETSSESAA